MGVHEGEKNARLVISQCRARLLHHFDSELMTMIFTRNANIEEVATLYSGAYLLLFHFAKYTWNNILDENQGVS